MRKIIFIYVLIFGLIANSFAQKVKFNAGVDIPKDVAILKVVDFEKSNKTHSDAIAQALEVAKSDGKFTRIILDSHDWFIDRAIEMHSDLELVIDGCKIKMKDHIHDNIIRCTNAIIDKNNPFGLCKENGIIKNFKITGKNGAALEGCDLPYMGYHPYFKAVLPFLGDYFGWRGLTICIADASDYEISGLKISKTKTWAISQEWSCRAYIHDITFDTDVKNGDGINFRNGCSDSVVENIFGKTGDDTVACTALGNKNNPRVRPQQMYSKQMFGPRFEREWRGIKNILICNIFTVGKHHGVICLATTPIVENIEIDNVYEPVESERHSVVKIYTGFGDGYTKGNLRNIKVRNVVSRGARWAVEVKADVQNVEISNIKQLKWGAELTNFKEVPAGVKFSKD